MATRPQELPETLLDRLQDLPPSAKLVAKTLEYEGKLTQTELVEETRLPPRTVRHAVSDLQKHDIIEGSISFSDARKRYYSLRQSDDQPCPEGAPC